MNMESRGLKDFGSAPVWLREMDETKRIAIVSSVVQVLKTTDNISAKQMIAVDLGISQTRADELCSWVFTQRTFLYRNTPTVNVGVQKVSTPTTAAASAAPMSAHASASDAVPMSDSGSTPRQVTAAAVNASDSIPLSKASLRPGVDPKTERDRVHVVEFLRNVSCFAIMPSSGKVVVLDTRVPTRLAFFALVEHGVTAASIFDELGNRHVGMLTSTDLIRILLHGYANTSLSEVFTMTIQEWFATEASHKASGVPPVSKSATAAKACSNHNDTSAPAHSMLQTPSLPEAAPSTTTRELISINADGSLMDAIALLTHHDINWLPVVDQKTTPASVLHVLTHSRVLRHLVNGCRVKHEQMNNFLKQSIFDLGIGTFGGNKIITATTKTPLVEVMTQLVAPGKTVSGIPILDAEGGIVKEIYYRVDAFYLTRIKNLREAHLSTAVGTVLAAQAKASVRNGLHTCHKTESLQSVVAKFGKTRTHTLVCVTSDGTCDGVVTVKDLFRFLLALDSV